MKPEAQRIAIAEACPTSVNIFQWHPDRPIELTWKGTTNVFDPLSDLNAMDEARTVLTPQQKADFVFILQCEVLGMPLPENEALWFASIHATAAQRAEAFLRTIGKWVE